eukprot:COSAG05_NODE_2019_length_3686_cov_1.730694_6_plen_94_part_00
MIDGECKLCEASYSTGFVVLFCSGVTAVVGCIVCVVGTACKQRYIIAIMPLIKCSFVPFKIAIVYCQVVAQLGNVLGGFILVSPLSCLLCMSN